jgi:hypothetical protein
MNWVLRHLGPEAIVYPGQQHHARAAVQSLSGRVPQEHIFTSLGWRKQAQTWIYLQAGGAISSSGISPAWLVQLPAALQHYDIAIPTDRSNLVQAVRSSLRFLEVAPDHVSLPLLAAVYRAPLGGVDFSLFLAGRTGLFKTALAALCQQHFGSGMNATSLPASFTSTANALEELAFAAKDALLVVDDFVPVGGVDDRALHGIAERLFRAMGNHQGRSRLNRHG